MKKLTLTLSILCAFCALTYAGDTYSGKEMKRVATTQPADCPSWTGFYIGGFGGYKFGATDVDLDLGGSWVPGFPADVDALTSTTRDLDTSGGELGGLLGYNFQINNWVIGAEATGGYLWLRDSDTTGHFVIPATGAEYHVSTSFKTHFLTTFGPRIGYAWCRWLPYITGGLAVGDIDFEQHITQHDIFFRQGDSTSETKAGWMVGGGLQYAINDKWSARAQYQFVDLGSVDVDHSGRPNPPFGSFTGESEFSLREHNASFALIYQF